MGITLSLNVLYSYNVNIIAVDEYVF
jgi:hypothetical protein